LRRTIGRSSHLDAALAAAIARTTREQAAVAASLVESDSRCFSDFRRELLPLLSWQELEESRD
jgi:hypothetical protein